MKDNYFSHTRQDMWVAETLGHKRCGYFLDFGSFDGVNHSNSFYFEKYLGWSGICVEANPHFYAANCAVRNCISVNYALWPESRQLIEIHDSHGLSSVKQFAESDSHAEFRIKISCGLLAVDTINPTELLDRHCAPEYIDYLSLDIEGCELEVLQSLNLEKYKIALMSVEHNHNQDKQKSIRDLLDKFSYRAIEHRNDDLFYNPAILEIIASGSDPVAAHKKTKQIYKLREY